MCCVRCGRHLDELTPFDFDDQTPIYHCGGKRLVQNFRDMDFVDYNENCEQILQDIDVFDLNEDLYQFYGVAKIESALLYESMRGNCELSWECRDCIKEEGPFKHYNDSKD